MEEAMKSRHGVPRQRVLLVVLDGFGVNPSRLNNAVALAHTPSFDRYFAHYPHTLLQASGAAVGLPEGQMGNSEVGHLTLGCGSVIHQDLVRIDDAVASGTFFENPALTEAMDKARTRRRPVHLLGLVSDGGVHSHLNHLLALIELGRRCGARPLLHMITDGRDTPPKSALNYLPVVLPALERAGGAMASIMGRYWAMDRDRRWERTEVAWRALVKGEGRRAETAAGAIESAYHSGETDEFIRPVMLPGYVSPQDGDSLIFFNFRKDRPRQIIYALHGEDFRSFERGGDFPRFDITCMMPYDSTSGLPYAFLPERPEMTLGQVVSDAGLKQLRCAETEKYPHVTYFFNGGRQEPFPGEHQVMVPSPKVATYDLQPEMSASEVAKVVIEGMKSGTYDFILVNFANGDMVGHTAVPEAVIQAVEVLDREVGKVLDVALEAGYSVVLTADHGNCEEMVDPVTNMPHTQHTTYPVPCLVIDRERWQLSTGGGLAGIAPTVLQLMGLTRPGGMHAHSLLLDTVLSAAPQAAIPQAA
jgi:2,3-bisphosphoglycerate-independent phosphoglycerate mutase